MYGGGFADLGGSCDVCMGEGSQIRAGLSSRVSSDVCMGNSFSEALLRLLYPSLI